ncbi:MAG: hypothetical protein HY770_02330 [Chitinivibrionia bacterium]|nr:hypothetical protein [Chitinivibrionia bacterium]
MTLNIQRYRLAGRGAMFAAALAVFFAVWTPASRADQSADEAAAQQAEAKQILEQSLEALGGMQKTTGWQTRIDSGRMVSIRPGWGTLQAKATQFIKKPDKMKFDQDFSAYDHPFFFIYYYNAGEVWVDVNLGIRQNPRYTEQLTNTMKRIDGVGHFLAACDTFFVVKDVPDDSLIAASTVQRVGVVEDGDTLLFDIDTATRFPVRRIEESGTTHVLMDDYRDIAGMKVPFHVVGYHNGEKATEYFWETITFNEKIDDAIFEENKPKKEEAK